MHVYKLVVEVNMYVESRVCKCGVAKMGISFERTRTVTTYVCKKVSFLVKKGSVKLSLLDKVC